MTLAEYIAAFILLSVATFGIIGIIKAFKRPDPKELSETIYRKEHDSHYGC